MSGMEEMVSELRERSAAVRLGGSEAAGDKHKAPGEAAGP